MYFFTDMFPSGSNTEKENELEKILNKNKDLMNKIKLAEIYDLEKVVPDSNPEKEGSVIKPYTESQLSALYYNGELDALESFESHFIEAELKGLLLF